MAYILNAASGKTLEGTFSGSPYVSPLTQHTECVAFLQTALVGIPGTTAWKEGRKVTKGDGTILPGTAIATFVDGKYPGPGRDKHAAIYLGQDAEGIQVLDQWAKQGKVLKRTIRWLVPVGTGIQNDATKYSVIE
jgi:hypothetical protein